MALALLRSGLALALAMVTGAALGRGTASTAIRDIMPTAAKAMI